MPSSISITTRNAVLATWLCGALSGTAAAAGNNKGAPGKEARHAVPLAASPGPGPGKPDSQSSPRRRTVLAAPLFRRPYEPVELFAPGHRERLLFRPFDSQGHPRKGARRELSHFLRCVHTGEEHPVDGRLGPVLYRVGRHFGKRLVVFSGYRPKTLSTRPHSRHLTAAAVDFNIPGVRNDDLVRWLRGTMHPLGVGYYPDGTHVHLDVDRRYDAYWVQKGSDALPLGARLLARAPQYVGALAGHKAPRPGRRKDSDKSDGKPEGKTEDKG